jgi:hypothetical protein
MAAERLMNFVDDPIGGLGTFQFAANVIINPIYVGDGILIDFDSLDEIGLTSVRDPIAGEPLATSLLHIIDVEGGGEFPSIAAFKGGLDLSLQPIEIPLMCAELFDAVLRRYV